jgi:hypothetical protein
VTFWVNLQWLLFHSLSMLCNILKIGALLLLCLLTSKNFLNNLTKTGKKRGGHGIERFQKYGPELTKTAQNWPGRASKGSSSRTIHETPRGSRTFQSILDAPGGFLVLLMSSGSLLLLLTKPNSNYHSTSDQLGRIFPEMNWPELALFLNPLEVKFEERLPKLGSPPLCLMILSRGSERS